jgi:hypothetical protein
MTEILLKMTLNTITVALCLYYIAAIISTDNINNKADKGNRCRISLEFLKILDTHPLLLHRCEVLY